VRILVGPLFIVLTVGCYATTPRKSDSTTPVQRFSTCTTDVIKDRAGHLLDDVASAVATGGYEAALANLMVKAGAAEVKCAVDLFIDSVTGRKAEADTLAAQQLARATAWRNANP